MYKHFSPSLEVLKKKRLNFFHFFFHCWFYSHCFDFTKTNLFIRLCILSHFLLLPVFCIFYFWSMKLASLTFFYKFEHFYFIFWLFLSFHFFLCTILIKCFKPEFFLNILFLKKAKNVQGKTSNMDDVFIPLCSTHWVNPNNSHTV